MSAFHRHVAANRHGRDFVVSDLHGHLAALDQALQAQRFIPGRDRLFSVGDLVDRGPDSPGCVALLDKLWFHAVRGNHEDMLLRMVMDPDPRIAASWLRNGGQWGMIDLSAADSARAAAPALAKLPWALTLHHRNGLRFGICHAECPVGDWSIIESGDCSEPAQRAMIWGRDRLHQRDVPPVAGIDLTIHGHTVVPRPFLTGNALFIETGAYLPHGHLTLLCLDDVRRAGNGFSIPGV